MPYYVVQYRTAYGQGPSGKRYKKRKPERVNYGPFQTEKQAVAWMLEKGVLHATIETRLKGTLIIPKSLGIVVTSTMLSKLYGVSEP